jgi:cell division cycle 14
MQLITISQGDYTLWPVWELRNQDFDPRFWHFSSNALVTYTPFADDFGPMNLGSIYRFCRIVDEELENSYDHPVALIASHDSKSFTNSLFLLGAYMILMLDSNVQDLMLIFAEILDSALAYRDVSPGDQNFELYIADCWAGLFRAKSLTWICFRNGGFDFEEYQNFDNPLNADLHEIIPGKLVAMRGPKDMENGDLYQDIYLKQWHI